MKKYLIYCVIAVAAFGCSQEKRSYGDNSESAKAVALDGNDTALVAKVIKTADMKFRVKDVQDTKEKLSAAVRADGGEIQEFNIQSDIRNTEKVAYSTDSLLELTAYRKEGYLVARIPSEHLDEFTNTIARMAVFVDNQSLKLDDQSISYLANKLKNQNKVVAAAQMDKHATKAIKAVDQALAIKDQAVDKKIENLSIDSRVKYSTITLSFYQDNTVKKLVIANDSFYELRPGFGHRLILNLQSGWMIFKEILLFLANLWMLILLAGAGYVAYRYYRKQKNADVAA